MKYLICCVALMGLKLSAIPCLTPDEAKGIAECETIGEAVSVRFVEHNSGFGKWEVLVHMEDQSYGWRVFIDRDNGKIIEKVQITNPPSKVSRSNQ